MTVADQTESRIVLVGANGMLASAVRRLAPRQFELIAFDLPEFDLTDRQKVLDTLLDLRPRIVINCAAYTNVDGCETAEVLASRVNGDGPGFLAEAAKVIGADLVHISTDYVFDGSKLKPYTEVDETRPLSAYGRSKLLGERAILNSGLERYYIIRTSWLYGRGGKNFVETIIRLAREKDELRIVADQFGSPTLTDDLARAIFNLLETKSFGLYHFSNEGECSWYEFGTEIVAQMTAKMPLKATSILPIATEEYPLPAVRPRYSVFSKEKYRRVTGALVPHWRESLAMYLRTRED